MAESASWFHVTGSTYGTWVRGDGRGWRARHHREHCDGEYRNPPEPGQYEHLEILSHQLMSRAEVHLSPQQREQGGMALRDRLLMAECQPAAISLDAVHYHILARFPSQDVRRIVGLAKKHASHVLRNFDLPGRVWAKRCGIRTVRDQEHLRRVHAYILRHAQRGAWTWQMPTDCNPWA